MRVSIAPSKVSRAVRATSWIRYAMQRAVRLASIPRAKESTWSARSATCRALASIIARTWAARLLPGRSFSVSIPSRIGVSTLLRSCAIPQARLPRVCSRSARSATGWTSDPGRRVLATISGKGPVSPQNSLARSVVSARISVSPFAGGRKAPCIPLRRALRPPHARRVPERRTNSQCRCLIEMMQESYRDLCEPVVAKLFLITRLRQLQMSGRTEHEHGVFAGVL